MVFALEPLAYYFNIKPEEYWDSKYSEINLYIHINMIRILDDFKSNIMLQEAVTDKMIRADSMSKRPKVISLKKMFKNLFHEEAKLKFQPPEEQIKRLRKLK